MANKRFSDINQLFRTFKAELCRAQGCADLTATAAYFVEAESNKLAIEWASGSKREFQPIAFNNNGSCIIMSPIMGEDPYDFSTLCKTLPPVPINGIAVASEGYISVAEETKYSHGDMRKDFEQNPFTTVQQILMVSCYDTTGDSMEMFWNKYKWGDRGEPVFDEPERTDTHISVDPNSRVPKTLEALAKFHSVSLEVYHRHPGMLEKILNAREEDMPEVIAFLKNLLDREQQNRGETE